MDAMMANVDGGGGADGRGAGTKRVIGDADPLRAPAPTPPPTPAPMHTKMMAVRAKKRRVRVGLVSALMEVASSGSAPGAVSISTRFGSATGTTTIASSSHRGRARRTSPAVAVQTPPGGKVSVC